MHGSSILPSRVRWALYVLFVCLPATGGGAQEAAWQRWAIDNSLHGADGVRLADANGDGRVDIVTGWEESGQVRAYFHPGRDQVTRPWPQVTLGDTPSIEDAVWVDLTGDGQLDVLSSCEGREQSLRMHIAPTTPTALLQSSAWKTVVLPCSQQVTRWMFAYPLPAAREAEQVEVVVGSKAPNGMVGLLRVRPREGFKGSLEEPESSLEKLVDASWIMSILLLDVDRDGDPDIVYSDRKAKTSGVYWLENPGSLVERTQTHPLEKDGKPRWTKHSIGAIGQEVMFMVARPQRDESGQTRREFFVAVKPHQIHRFAEAEDPRDPWLQEVIEVEPAMQIGRAKAVAVGDLDLDGMEELVFSCESATPPKSGCIYLRYESDIQAWKMHDVSGPEGIKFDRLELVDLDLDGDLDILTCEERAGSGGLGVIWYANPHR